MIDKREEGGKGILIYQAGPSNPSDALISYFFRSWVVSRFGHTHRAGLTPWRCQTGEPIAHLAVGRGAVWTGLHKVRGGGP